MKRTITLLVTILVLAASSFSTTHVINSLPYTFSGTMQTAGVDTLVLGSSKLTSSTSGITLQSTYGNPIADVVLDLRGDTIVFGTGGGDNNTGIRITGLMSDPPHNIKVVGGYISHEPSDTTAERNYCLNITGNNNIIENVSAVIRGFNGKAFISQGVLVYDNILRNSTFRSEVTAFDSRCNFDAAVVHLLDLRNETIVDNNASYHYLVDNITINGGPHVGLAVHGRIGNTGATVILQNNDIMTDARNDMYLTYSGTCLSTSNPYGIACSGITSGTLIYNNRIRSGTQRGGNRGILIEGATGVASNPVIIRKNDVDVHEGPNVEYGDNLPTHAFRIRYHEGVTLVDSNTFIVRGDNSSATAHTGSQVHAVRCSSGDPGQTQVTFANNTIRAISLSTSGVSCNAVTYDAIEYDSLYITRNNYITSSGNIYKFGEGNGNSHGQLIEGDTVSFETTQISPRTYNIGHLGNNFICDGSVSKDVTYLNGTSFDDIQFGLSGTEDLTLQKTIQVLVRGSNTFAVENANVSIINNYGNVVLNTQTNSAGIATGPITYWYESRTNTDSTSYNNFSLVVEKGSDIYTTDLIINAAATSMKVCTLSNTAGEIDSIPPADVDDLSALPGSTQGSINLSWTAPGDDGTAGTASHYVVKYSQSSISEGSFNAASTAINPPTPVVGGATQNMVLSGLTPGALYYVAIKAYDYSDNVSGISNLASAEAYIDLGTGGEDSTDMYITQGMVPPNGASVSSTQPTLSALNIQASGTNNYFFELASDASFSNMVTTSGAVTESNTNYTAWQVDQSLAQGQTYFWRVRVNSNPYSQVASFSTLAAAAANYDPKAYPNPIDFSTGTMVTFDLPSSSCDLLITTVSGETVLLKTDLTGSFQWNGKNEAGGTVAVGQTYLWYITSEGTTYKGKISVIG